MKKLLLSFLTSLIILLSFAPFMQAKAQATWYSQNPVEWYLKVYDPSVSPPNEIFGERYTAAQVQWIVYSFIFMPVRMIASAVGENAVLCVMKQAGTGTLDVNNCVDSVGDLSGKLLNFIFPQQTASSQNQSFLAAVFDTSGRGMSGIKYTQDLIAKLSPVTPVKAQGIGFVGLTWVAGYWRGVRNIAYTLLVPIVLVFAFMIMFRVKLNPQTVISVQIAIPKIIVAMILITFSYAIAGFAIDLMYVFSGLLAVLVNAAGFSPYLIDMFRDFSGIAWGYRAAGGFWIFFSMLGYSVMFFIAAIFAAIGSLISGFNLFGMVLGIVYAIVAIWVLILCIWYTFKIPFVMIKTLISLYVNIITGPLQILFGTIAPSMSFSSWLKRLMADILVFPLIGFFNWLAWSLLWSAYANIGIDLARFFTNHLFTFWSFQPDAWIPGIIGSSGLGANVGLGGVIFLAMSFGVIVLMPKIPDILKNIIMGERFDYGSAIGEAQGALKSGWGYTGAPIVGEAQKEIGNKAAKRIGTEIATKYGERLEKLSSRFFKKHTAG